MAGILGNSFGWTSNPLYQGYDKNRNAIGNAFAGLIGATDFAQGAKGVAQGALMGQQVDTAAARAAAEAEKSKQAANATIQYLSQNEPELAVAIQNGMPMDQALEIARANATQRNNLANRAPVDPTSTATGRAQLADQNGLTGAERQEYILTGKLSTARGAGGEMSLQPSYGVDEDPKSPTYNQIVAGQLNKNGQFVKTQAPPGIRVLSPGDIAGDRAAGGGDAKTAATARASLPAAEQSYALTKKAISDIQANKQGISEQFGNVLGVPQQMTPAWPGSAKANLRNQVDQLSGQAFLQVRQALKGAGQVTDFEGQKGEVAISQMKAAAERGDEAAFQQALIDFNNAVDNGLRLLREQANGGYSAGSQNVTSTAPPVIGNGSSLKSKYGLE